MKKKSNQFFWQVVAYLFGMALAILGAIILVASMFYPLPSMNGVILVGFGVIIIQQSVSLDKYHKSLGAFSEILKENEEQKKSNQQDSTALDYAKDFPFIKEIIIDGSTSAEDIEKLKQENPELQNSLDFLMGKMQGVIKDEEVDPIKYLEQALEKAIAEEDFEKAAMLKKEITKIKPN